MKNVIITGSCGLIGSQSVFFFHDLGFNIIGIDDDSRGKFFGSDASTSKVKDELSKLKNYTHYSISICEFEILKKNLSHLKNVDLIIHTAAQPSHDWAASNPFLDFNTNALGTLNMLEITRQLFPESVFIFTSTNKVYGDTPNKLEYKEIETRYEPVNLEIKNNGIDETMSIDNSKHSLFGVSKVYGDLIVQEYGKYFNIKTGIFRGGCLTGSKHCGVEAHGFLSYLIKCALTNKKYTIYGYKGKQVRDNIHSYDVVSAFYEFYKNPKMGEVYNIGGSLKSNCSVLEAINLIQEYTKIKINYEIVEKNREGDHIWYISDMRKFKKDYPSWNQKYELADIIKDMI
jgi:CDP-paratose 2-epimerase